MNDVVFGRLKDLVPREAWPHEALSFTPWLAANIDQLSDAIGIPLELTGTEIAVEIFAADILARNPADGTVVLIENQLEQTDHTHFGQIMTYLAGLEAQTVVWIAPKFREPHLSAIRWLNAHTVDGFSFFAVRLRVVRIGDSPYAPIFEVVEKPNNWDRLVTRVAEPRGDITQLGQFRRDFWTAFSERHPLDGMTSHSASSSWCELFTGRVIVALWVGSGKVGLFVRHPRNADANATYNELLPFSDQLAERLDAKLGSPGNQLFGRDLRIEMADRNNWSAAIDWLHQQRHHYETVLSEILSGRFDHE